MAPVGESVQAPAGPTGRASSDLDEGILLAQGVDLYRFYHTGDEETLALRGVSVGLAAGEIVAVVGPSGSGKSTLLACMAGLDDPDGGTVTVCGERMSRRREAERARLRASFVGVLMQSGNLLEHLSVLDNVRLAQSLSPNTARDAATLLDSVGLGRRMHATPSHLSGGEAARAGLAVALASDPRIVLADEPTGEVDAHSERAIVALLRAEAEGGSAIMVVTHSDRLAAAADRVVRLHDGARV